MKRIALERLAWTGLTLAAAAVAWTAGTRHSGSGGDPGAAPGPDAPAVSQPVSPGSVSSAGGPAEAARVPIPADRSRAAIREFARETLEEPHALTRYKMLIGLLNNLTPGNWEEVVAEFEAQRERYGRRHEEEWYAFLLSAGEVAGKDAMQMFYDDRDISACRLCLSGWAAADPEGAIDWLESEAEAGIRDRIWGSALRGIAQTQPEIAINLLEQLPPGDRRSYTNDLMPVMIQAVGVVESTRLFEDMARRAAEAGDDGEAYLRDMFGQLAGRRLANSSDPETTAETAAWVGRHVGEPYADRSVVAETARQLSSGDAESALSWLDSLERLPAGSPEPAGYAAVVRALTETSGLNTVAEWLNEHRDHPHYGRLVIPHAGNVAAEYPQAAAVWVDSITDPVLRQRAVEEVQRHSPGRN